jgi:superfamily II DNA or RNA helicase
VFTESIEAAREIAARLSGSGRITATALHSQLGRDERKDLLGRFKAGHIRAVVAPRVLDEGVDVPEADLAIIAASSKTRRQMVQRMGRVLRRKADGRLARFAVLYLKGTTEDPTRGTHESFLEEVTDVADEPPMVFDAASERSEVIDYLNDYKPATTQPPR